MTLINILFALAGFAAGLAGVWMFFAGRMAGLATEKRLLSKEREDLLLAKNEATDALIAAEKQLALIEQDIRSREKQMNDWKTLQEQMLQAAKAAVVGTSNEISNKLLADHKREAEAMKKESEEKAKKLTEGLVEKVKDLGVQFSHIKEHNNVVHKQFTNMTRMLSSSQGAGSLAEVGLENALKSLGLISGRDFLVQYTISGGEAQGLRPDCLVYLPQDSVMVIDSKSSKLLGELADIDSAEKEKALVEKLSISMNQHLKKLASKNYADAVRKEYASAGRSAEISLVWNVMYVPSESLIEKILSVDSGFRQKCMDENIILAGPAGIYSLLLMAARQIEIAKQSENTNHIIKTVGTLVENFAASLSHLAQFSKQFRTAAGTFEKVTGSMNRSVISKLSDLSTLGITTAKSKDIARLPTFEVHVSHDAQVIEGEAQEEKILALRGETT